MLAYASIHRGPISIIARRTMRFQISSPTDFISRHLQGNRDLPYARIKESFP